MTPWFIATRPFTPKSGEFWDKYIAWSGLTQLEEVLSLDGILCPTLLRDIRPDYWPYIVQESFLTQYFLDFGFLENQIAEIIEKNVLCVFRNPEDQPLAPSIADFEFCGYDLVEDQTGISALTNCGGFPDVFDNSELSRFGLLPEFERARDAQRLLRMQYPQEPHANCSAWAIFRATRGEHPSKFNILEL